MLGLIIIIVAIPLNVYGLRWGLPSRNRNELYFSNDNEIREVVAEITPEMVRHSWHISRKMREKGLVRSTYDPIRTYHADEQAIIKCISNMNPEKHDFNPHHFDVPTLFIYLVALSLKVASAFKLIIVRPDIVFYFFNPGEIAKFYMVGRILAVSFSLGSIYLTYLLGSRIGSPRAGLLACLFLAITPLYAVNSHFMYFDIPQLFWMLCAAIFTINILKSDRLLWYSLAGISAGLAASTKYYGGLIMLMVPLAHFLKGRQMHRRHQGLLVTLALALCAFLVGSPYIVLDFREFLTESWTVTDKGALDIGGISFYLSNFPRSTGWVLCLGLIAGILTAFAKRKKADLLLAIWVLCYVLIMGVFSKKYIHYMIPAIPFSILLMVKTFASVRNKVAARLLVLIVLFPTLLHTICYESYFSQDIRMATGKWVAENLAEGTSIGIPTTPWLFHTPPINRRKYNIVTADPTTHEFAELVPDYYLVGDYEVTHNMSRAFSDMEEFATFMKNQHGYEPARVFKKEASICGFRFRSTMGRPMDWYLNPEFVVLQRKD